MRKSRFSEEQIIAILKESETGELCRRHVIIPGCFYRWEGKVRRDGGESGEKGCGKLEEESHQLKHTVGELLLDKRALQAVVAKKW